MALTTSKRTVYTASDGKVFLDPDEAHRYETISGMVDVIEDLDVCWAEAYPEAIAKALFESGYTVVKDIRELPIDTP